MKGIVIKEYMFMIMEGFRGKVLFTPFNISNADYKIEMLFTNYSIKHI